MRKCPNDVRARFGLGVRKFCFLKKTEIKLTSHDVLHLVTLLDCLLGNDLDCEDLAVLLVLCEHDLVFQKEGGEIR